MAKVNFTEDDVARGKVVDEAGWIPVKIEKHEQKVAKTDNSALFVYHGKALDGKYKGTIFYAQFSEKAMGMMIPFVNATGVKVGPKGLSGFDTESPVGKTMEFYVKPDVYQGKPKNNVADFRPTGSGRSV